jgi:hypothetical protein
LVLSSVKQLVLQWDLKKEQQLERLWESRKDQRKVYKKVLVMAQTSKGKR